MSYHPTEAEVEAALDKYEINWRGDQYSASEFVRMSAALSAAAAARVKGAKTMEPSEAAIAELMNCWVAWRDARKVIATLHRAYTIDFPALAFPVVEVWRHKKRGTTYDAVGDFELQASRQLVEGDIVRGYVCRETGKRWAREVGEFEDGRFAPLPPAPITGDRHE